MTAVAARARGLVTTVLAREVLADVDRASDRRQLALALSRAGLAGVATVDALERFVRERAGFDLGSLARWSDELDPLVLDEDRRSVRAIVRGLVARVSSRRKLASAVPTPRLRARTLAALAEATTLDEVVELLHGHPYREVLAAARAPIDLLVLELALARRFGELARTRDRALRTYVAQVIDVENAIGALLLAERGTGMIAADAFVPGGGRVDRAAFVAAAGGPLDAARTRLAGALAGTPVASALYAPGPGALEDAALAWQLAAQVTFRRIEPLGLGAVVHVVLRRREEARHLRRAAWRVALAGGAS